MQIINFGSLNIDYVYRVPHLVRPGETISSLSYQQFPGGKGFNQSIALSRAGASAHHVGKIGSEGEWLADMLVENGVNVDSLMRSEEPNGHALIQVEESGENAIVLFGGANRKISENDVVCGLKHASAGDYLLLQNEISNIGAIMEEAARKKMYIIFNPAPMDRAVQHYPLQHVSLFVVNETEGAGLTGETERDSILQVMLDHYPGAATVLTLGADGAIYADGELRLQVPAVQVDVVDTTAAGDTFIGYLLASLAQGDGTDRAMRLAVRAAALCVTREGAAPSIPTQKEVEELLD